MRVGSISQRRHEIESAFQPAPLNFLQRLIPALVQKHDQAAVDGTRSYEEAVAQHHSRESDRVAQLEALKAKHAELLQSERSRVDEFNAAIDEKAASYRACDMQSVIDYFTTVLENDVILESTAERASSFVPESKQLVVEYQLPTIEVIPTDAGYKYIKKGDDIQATPRKLPEVRRLYRDLLAQLACRALYAVADGDTAGVVDVVVLNGFVDTIDPGPESE